MTREKAIEMVRRYGAAIADERRGDAAEFGMTLVEALMKVKDDDQDLAQDSTP